jgi:hypothetical protein
MVAVSYLVSLLNLGCLIYVVIKMFGKEGALKAILGFICGLYAFIWGWQNIKTQDDTFKKVMYAWTGLILLGIVLNVVAQAMAQTLSDVSGALGG